MNSGQLLITVVTGKCASNDFAEFCMKTGNELLSSTVYDGEFALPICQR